MQNPYQILRVQCQGESPYFVGYEAARKIAQEIVKGLDQTVRDDHAFRLMIRAAFLGDEQIGEKR